MADPEHLHDLTDEEWAGLFEADREGLWEDPDSDEWDHPAYVLYNLVLITEADPERGNLVMYVPSDSGRAHLDKVEELARLMEHAWYRNLRALNADRPVGGTSYLTERGLVRWERDSVVVTPLGRAVLRAYERGRG